MPWPYALLIINLLAWTAFAIQAIRSRRTGYQAKRSLAFGLLHLLFIAPMSIAPLRALLEPETFHLGLGWLQVGGPIAALPAAMVWIWGLTAALVTVSRTRRRALRIVAAGDLIVAANFGTYFTVQILSDALRAFTAQAGEFVSFSGMAAAIALTTFFVVPFTLSAFWALREAALPPAAPRRDASASTRGTDVDHRDASRPLQMSAAISG